MSIENPKFVSFSMPLEEKLAVQHSKKQITIGIPKEVVAHENRIAIVPTAVALLVANGHEVWVETDAGKNAHFYDHLYSEAGALIKYMPQEIYKADIILKVAPLTLEEIDLLKDKATVISTLGMPKQQGIYFRKLMAKKITAISYENIKDKSGEYPIRKSMSEIVGGASILIGAEYLSNLEYGKGTMLGGIPGVKSTEVVILGAGTVAKHAAKAALGLGAQVKVFDNSIYKLRALLTTLSYPIYTSIIQPEVLLKALRTADVVIGAIYSCKGVSPCIITEDMVSQMKRGAVIVDVSIDQGGCVETSHETNHQSPIFKKYGVTHYCVPNIASRVPHTASYSLSNFFAPILLKVGEEGGIDNLIKCDMGVRHGIYLYNGILTDKYIGEAFSIPFQDLELFMAAFRH